MMKIIQVTEDISLKDRLIAVQKNNVQLFKKLLQL